MQDKWGRGGRCSQACARFKIETMKAAVLPPTVPDPLQVCCDGPERILPRRNPVHGMFEPEPFSVGSVTLQFGQPPRVVPFFGYRSRNLLPGRGNRSKLTAI